MSITDYISIIRYCKDHIPVAVYSKGNIYIHGYDDNYAYMSQIYEEGKVLFTKAEVTNSKYIVTKLKDDDGSIRTFALLRSDFIPVFANRSVDAIACEVLY